MKSAELSTALQIEARRFYRQNCLELQPWKQPSYVLRAHAFRDAWQYSVSQAAMHLAIPTKDPVFRLVYGQDAPTGQSDSGQDA